MIGDNQLDIKGPIIMDAQPPILSTDFLDRLGVNIRLEYTDGRYLYVDNVIEHLRYLGIARVRDGTLNPDYPGQHGYAQAARAGIKFNFIVGGGKPVSERLSLIHKFVLDFPGSVAAIEGPNEVNNWPVTYNGITGDAGAIAFQAALYDGVKADTRLSTIPVYNITSWPDLAGKADFANFHSYPHRGDQPRKTLTDNYATQANVMPGKPMVLTETGYYTLPGKSGWGGVDEPSHARMTLNLIMDAVRLGVKDIYLYELLDAYPDPENNNQEKHFGLFDYNSRPKLAATAIHNMTSILRSGSFENTTPVKLEYAIDNMPKTSDSLVLQKTADIYTLIIWNEPDIWDENNSKSIPATPHAVNLKLPQKAKFTLYDPLVSKEPLAETTGHTTRIELTDHPIIVEINLTKAQE